MTTPMQFDHVSLTVSDLQRSIDFYCRGFGFEVVSGPREASAPSTAAVLGYEGAHIKVAHLKLGEHFLELIEYLNQRGEHRPRFETKDVGTPHLAFQSADIQADYERLKQLGVRFKSEPQLNPAGTLAVYGIDVDGIPLELIQRPQLVRRAALVVAPLLLSSAGEGGQHR